jgi:hypothetical protein
MITGAERRELRSVVKSQFKVLRTEVGQREVELQAETEQVILRRYQRHDEVTAEAQLLLRTKLRAVVDEMQAHCAEVNAREGTNLQAGFRGGTEPALDRSDNRHQERRTLVAAVREQVKTASLGLDRQEADLLRAIATDALETDEARSWLAQIPTVAELVPARRLREIEAQLDSQM